MAVSEFQDLVRAQNAEFLAYYGDGWSDTTPDVTFATVSEFGFTGGYITGDSPRANILGTPNFAVVDLHTGVLIADNLMSGADILEKVTLIHDMHN